MDYFRSDVAGASNNEYRHIVYPSFRGVGSAIDRSKRSAARLVPSVRTFFSVYPGPTLPTLSGIACNALFSGDSQSSGLSA